MPVPSAVHERLCQLLIRHYRHHLRPDNLSQAICHLRVGGTLKDNLIVTKSEVQEIQRLSGCVHKTDGGKTRLTSRWMQFLFSYLNNSSIKLSTTISAVQTTWGERGRELKDRFTATDLSQPMLFCPRANLGDIKEKHDEKPPNDTQ